MDKQLFVRVVNSKVIGGLVFKFLTKKEIYGCSTKVECYSWVRLINSPVALAGNNYFELLKKFIQFNPDAMQDYQFRIYKGAIARGSLEMFQYLVELHLPKNCNMKMVVNDFQRYAADYNRGDIIEYLVDRYKDLKYGYKLDYAYFLPFIPQSGNLQLLKSMVETYLARENTRSLSNPGPLYGAAYSGNLDMIKYLEQYIDYKAVIPDIILRSAVSSGSMPVVQYLFNLLGVKLEPKPKLQTYTSTGHSDEYRDDDEIEDEDEREDEDEDEQYVRYEDEESEQGSGDEGRSDDEDEYEDNETDFMFELSIPGKLEIAKYLFESKYIVECNSLDLKYVVDYNNLDLVKYIHESFQSCDFSKAMQMAAYKGHFEIVKWLHENRSDVLTTSVVDSAAAGAHHDIVVWLLNNRTEGCTKKTYDQAKGLGWKDITKFLKNNKTMIKGRNKRKPNTQASSGPSKRR